MKGALVDPSLQLLAWDDGEIAGICVYAPHQPLQPSFGWVDVLSVRPP